MSELQALYLTFAVIYLLQCAFHVSETAIVFRGRLRGGWRALARGLALGAPERRFGLNHPLPPFASSVHCEQWPVGVSPDGVFAAVPRSLTSGGISTAPAGFAAFNTAEQFTCASRDLCTGKKILLRLTSPVAARHFAAFLEKLRRQKPGARAAAIEGEIARSLDTARIGLRLAEYERTARPVRGPTHILFLYLFVVVPLVIAALGLARTWLPLLGGMVAQVALIAWRVRQAHRALYPRETDTRWTTLLTLVLSPAAAIRAEDALLRDLLAEFHPLAAARVLLDDEAFRALASRALRDACFPLSATVAEEPEQADVQQWWRERMRLALESFFARSIKHPESLLGPPPRSAPECVTYCPRCWNEFVVAEGTCSDCPSISLRPFPQP